MYGDYVGGNYNYEDVVRATFCYLHAELEDMAGGYDVFTMLKSELKPEQFDDWNRLTDEFGPGIYPCVCMGEPCTFFRWKNNGYHGLVVLNTDKDAYEYASKAYEQKRISI
jgi:hypothetical protein